MPSFMYKNEKFGGVTPKQENIGMGSKDISKIGDGTLTGALETLNENKLGKTGDSKDNITTFTSNDSTSVSEWSDVEAISSGETHASIFSKMSQMFKNVRYLWKLMGKSDISKIGDGTATGALSSLNENKLGKTANAASASKLENARTIRTNLASTSSASFDGSTNITPGVTGTLPASNGGTGKTNLEDSANALINALSIGTSDPVDGDYYVAQYAGGGTSKTTYYRRPVSALWNYIKGKISSVLGISTTGWTLTRSTGNTYIDAVRSDTGTKVRFGIGANGTNHGLWSDKLSKWMVYGDANSVYLNGNATSANKLNTNAGNSSTPVYFSEGIPKACSNLGTLSSFFGNVYSPSLTVQYSRGTTYGYSAEIYYSSSSQLMYCSDGGNTQYDLAGLVINNQCSGGIRLNAGVGRIFFEGSTVSASTAIATPSDPKIKNFTKDIENDEDKLIELYDRLIVKSYKLKSIDSNKNIIGLNAEDVETACNELGIDPEKYNFIQIDYNYRNGSEEDVKYYTKFRTLSYNDLFVLGILKNKKMEERIDSLESRLVELEERMSR